MSTERGQVWRRAPATDLDTASASVLIGGGGGGVAGGVVWGARRREEEVREGLEGEQEWHPVVTSKPAWRTILWRMPKIIIANSRHGGGRVSRILAKWKNVRVTLREYQIKEWPRLKLPTVLKACSSRHSLNKQVDLIHFHRRRG